jgi:hypothetical protein
MSAPILPPVVGDLAQWGRSLTRYLTQNLYKLGFKTADSNPSENGVILWDNVNGYPVVSKNNVFRQIVLEDGHYDGTVSTNQTAASINTAYALTFTQDLASGITNGTLWHNKRNTRFPLDCGRSGAIFSNIFHADGVNFCRNGHNVVLDKSKRHRHFQIGNGKHVTSKRLNACCD